MKEAEELNIQNEIMNLYSKYGYSEMFLYKCQLLYEQEKKKAVLEALERYHKEMDMLQDPTVYNVSDDLFKQITKQQSY